jgi:hypothetical protein
LSGWQGLCHGKTLDFSLDGPGDDLLSFHWTQRLDANGVNRWTYVPAGHYRVRMFVKPDSRRGLGNDVSRRAMASQEFEVGGDTEIELKLANVTNAAR